MVIFVICLAQLFNSYLVIFSIFDMQKYLYIFFVLKLKQTKQFEWSNRSVLSAFIAVAKIVPDSQNWCRCIISMILCLSIASLWFLVYVAQISITFSSPQMMRFRLLIFLILLLFFGLQLLPVLICTAILLGCRVIAVVNVYESLHSGWYVFSSLWYCGNVWVNEWVCE